MSLVNIRAKDVLFRISAYINSGFCHCIILASKGNCHFFYTNIPIDLIVYLVCKTNEQRVRQKIYLQLGAT